MRTRIAIVSLLFATLPCLAATPEELRAAGPAGMEALLAQGGSGETLDRVCGVRDCADIHLFWYTDLEAAKKQARAENKPILSLRLLGRLDEEFSCANSRYFRTVYYKNREINDLLRERFVLHWRSVRPVPKVTIDFGDGNRLERTLTGNSIHYVLDSRGRLVEALPGLSGPETFLALLKDSERAAGEAARLSDANLVRWAIARHARQLNGRAESYLEEIRSLVAEPEPEPAPEPEPVVAEAPQPRTETDLEKIPTARDPWALLASTPGVLTDRINVGGLETGSKSSGEQPLLAALDDVTDGELQDLAKLRRPRIHLDADSRAFLLRKHGVTDPAEAERLVDAFETTVALDEVINEYRTGPAILKKLIDPEERKGLELEVFNEWVYEEVFRAPLSDPWMGLAPEDVYVALPAATRTAASSERPRP
jgi:hypothetical protein